MELTAAQQKYFAYWLTRSLPSDSLGKLTASLQDAQVDLTPHQIDTTIFTLKSSFSKGTILTDKIGNHYINDDNLNSFNRERIIIYPHKCAKADITYHNQTNWYLVIFAEAHQLHNVHKPISKISSTMKNELTDCHNNFFEEEMEKLDNWAEDVKAGLEKELRDIDAEIKLRKSESKKTSRLDEKVRIQRLIKDLEKRRSEKRLNLYQAQDDVDEKKETLLAKVEAMLAQKIEQTKLITFHWRIV